MCLSGEHTVRGAPRREREREGEMTCNAPLLLQPNTKVVVLGCKYDLIGRLLVADRAVPRYPLSLQQFVALATDGLGAV